MCPPEHIIIAGPICTGKTTLSASLAGTAKNAIAFPEKKGRFLGQFYRDSSFAFMNQLDYTIQMMERVPAILHHNGSVIEDRSIFDTHDVFSTMMVNDGLMTHWEFDALTRLCDLSRQMVQPTLLILLDCSPEVSFGRMRARGDQEEKLAAVGYLSQLRDHYLSWYARFDLCQKMLVETDALQVPDVLDRVMSQMMRLCIRLEADQEENS